MTTVSATDFSAHLQNYLSRAMQGEKILVQLKNKQLVALMAELVKNETVAKKQTNKVILGLDNLTDFKTILSLSKTYFVSEKQAVPKRIAKLLDLYDEEIEPSVESLKSMLIFLTTLAIDFKIPVITLNENGTFQVSWKKDTDNLITVRFKTHNLLDYVVFKPSHHVKKPIILNGNMNVFDFIEYIEYSNLVELIEE